MPAMTPTEEPLPEQLRTRTPCRMASFATPYRVPSAVPAQWVPWPWPARGARANSVRGGGIYRTPEPIA
eukprot:5997046-Pyramimonas_sp.AAC.1